MKRYQRSMGAAALLLVGSQAVCAQVVIYTKVPWSAERDCPFALWSAQSDSVAGTELEFHAKQVVVDSANLVPLAAYAVDQDVVSEGTILLHKGALLIGMIGGGRNWRCTWKFGAKADKPDSKLLADVSHGVGGGSEPELCLAADQSGHVYTATIMRSWFPALMTMTANTPGMTDAHLSSVNSVNLLPADVNKVPVRARLRINGKWRSAHGGQVCLEKALNGKDESFDLRSQTECFRAVGDSIDIGGGRYTLLSMGADKNFRVRIDVPAHENVIGPS